MISTVTKILEFEAAHHLPNYDGDCRNLHGHSYKLEVTVRGDVNPHTGMIIDFKEFKNLIKACAVDKYDHSNLNVFFDNPTAENVVQEIFKELSSIINYKDGDGFIEVYKIKLWETSSSFVEVTAEC